MADLFIDVHLSKAQLTLFCDGNCSLNVATDNVYSLLRLSLMAVVDGSSSSLRNAL